MPVYFEYALKVSISLAVVFLFYTALLKRLTHFKWNRYFLLSFLIISLLVPFVNVAMFMQAEQMNAVSFIKQIPVIINEAPTEMVASKLAAFQFGQIVGLLFLLVSLGLIIRLLIQLFSITKIKAAATLYINEEVKIYHLSKPIIPFSFLDSIYVNAGNYTPAELAEIIEHERVHVQQNHTLDVLISELICIINWYNPFAWLLKNAVKENLEFIADEAVINKGADPKSYQYLLLKVNGDLPLPVTNSFKFAALKTRILMMNKAKTSRFHLLKFVLFLPMLAFVLLAFRNNSEALEYNSAETKTSVNDTYKLTTLTWTIPDAKVKTIVLNDSSKSFLKPGELLDLSLIFNEKDRLKNLLESNGYKNLKSNAIRFMIDTTLLNNSFSVEVKIDVERELVNAGYKRFAPIPGEINEMNSPSSFNNIFSEKANHHKGLADNVKQTLPLATAYLNNNNSIAAL